MIKLEFGTFGTSYVAVRWCGYYRVSGVCGGYSWLFAKDSKVKTKMAY